MHFRVHGFLRNVPRPGWRGRETAQNVQLLLEEKGRFIIFWNQMFSPTIYKSIYFNFKEYGFTAFLSLWLNSHIGGLLCLTMRNMTFGYWQQIIVTEIRIILLPVEWLSQQELTLSLHYITIIKYWTFLLADFYKSSVFYFNVTFGFALCIINNKLEILGENNNPFKNNNFWWGSFFIMGS